MKKLFFLLLLFISVSSIAQDFQEFSITVDSVGALRSRAGNHKGLALVKSPDYNRNGEFIFYEYDSTSTDADDGALNIRVGILLKGAWKLLVTETVKASAFGVEAKDSDNEGQAGLKNMAGRLTYLMNYLRYTNTGRIRAVYLPPGYIFTGYFEVPSNVIIVGSGGTTEQSGRSGTTLVQYPGLNQDIMCLKGTQGSTIVFWQGDIVNIKFKGSPTATAGCGITTKDSTGAISTPSDLSRVSGCIFRDIAGYNLYLANGAAPMLIEFCKFLNGKTKALVAERPTIGESGLQNLEINTCSFDAILDIPLLIKNFGSKSQVNIRGFKNEARRNSAAGNQPGGEIAIRFEESAVKAKIDGAYHTSSINDGGDTTRYPGPLIEIVSTAGRKPTLNISNAVIRLPEGPNSGDTPVLIKGTHIDYDATDVKFGGKNSQLSDTINGSASILPIGSEGYRIRPPLAGRYPILPLSGAWPGMAFYQPPYLGGVANKTLSYLRLRNGNITFSNYADDGTEHAFYNQSFGSAGNGQRATWQIVEHRQIANMPKNQFINNGVSVPVNAGGWEWRARSSSTNILGFGTISDDAATYNPGFDIVRSMNFTRPGGMYMYMPFIFGGPTSRSAGTSVFATLANVNDSVGNGKDENSWTVVNATAKDLVRLDSVQVNQLIILHFADGNTTMRNKRPAIATQNQFLLQGGYDWNPTANSMWAGMKVGSYIVELGRSYGTYTGSLPWVQNQYSTFQAASARLDSLQSKYFKPGDSVFVRFSTPRGLEWGTDAKVTGNNVPLSATARSNSRLFMEFSHTAGSGIGSAPILSTRDTSGVINFQVDGRSLFYRGVKISDGTIWFDNHPTTVSNAYAVVVYDSIDKAYRTIPASSLPGGGGGSGTVNSGTANRLAYYNSTGTTVSQLAAMTAARAVITDANGLPTNSTVTATELSYLSGVISGVQGQINNRTTEARVIELIGEHAPSGGGGGGIQNLVTRTIGNPYQLLFPQDSTKLAIKPYLFSTESFETEVADSAINIKRKGERYYEAQTTNATAANTDYPVTASDVYQITIRATSAAGLEKHWEYLAPIKWAPGGCTLLGGSAIASVNGIGDSGISSASVAISINGTDLRIARTGIASTTINWNIIVVKRM
ncbi:hypothetical protein [Foetidibacter luteolus]|uniref:hypothetical protein n=1 Tax=Foetidibacter luteolus TaxID=2608880 RepID=UPI00129AD0E9|nr:hypothetical protein [Foetidibacter luteolus]